MAVAIVFNPISGAGRALRVAQRLRTGLEVDGLEVELLPTERGPAESWLRPRLGPGLRAIVVAGGDGAVRMVAPEAARAGLPVWHAPCGTENLFARAHGMTADPRALARALVGGRTARLDLGRINGEPFALMASVGFDAAVVHELSRHRRGAISHLSYLRPILRLLGAWRASRVVWEIDGEAEALGPGLVVIGNHRDYGVRLNPACDAEPGDGLLDAVHIPVERAAGLIPWAALLRTGLHARHPAVRMRRGRRIGLWLDPAAAVQCDGDAVLGEGAGFLDIRVEPGVLEVLLPAPPGGAGRS